MAHILANGLRQHYRQEGDPQRPVLVLAHPVGFDLQVWDDIAPLLTPHWHLLRYDLRGHGETEVTPGDYSVQQLAADVLLLTYELGIERFAFCGISLGGLVGLWLGAHHPKALTHLVVSNASACLPLSREEWDLRIALARGSGMAGFAESIRARMFSATYRESGAPLYPRLMESLLSSSPLGYAASLAALRDADLRPLLAHIRVPTLVVGGEVDAAVPRDHLEAMANGVVGARLCWMPGGHLSPVEASRPMADLLVDFIGMHRSPSA